MYYMESNPDKLEWSDKNAKPKGVLRAASFIVTEMP